MQLSENTNELFSALAKFQGDCPTVAKDATVKVKTRNGGSYTFDYATLKNILETTKPTLAENELALIQFTETDGVSTMITHSSGQWLKTEPLKLDADPRFDNNGHELPPTPQDIGSMLTYAKRYQVAGLLKVDALDDDDSNFASGNDADKTTKGKSTPTKKESKSTPKKSESKKEEKTSEGEKSSIEDLLEQCKNAKTRAEAIGFYQKALDTDREEALKHRDDWNNIMQSF